MSRLKRVELLEFWRARVRRFEVVGQTVAEFCQWDGVSAAAFYLWRKKLGELAPKHKTPVTTKSGDVLRRPLFVPVVSAARPKSAARPVSAIKPVAATAAIVVMTLSDGTRVELPANDHQLIAHVVTSTQLHEASTQLHETSTLLEQKISLLLQQANLIEQQDALLGEQSATIRKQEEKLAAKQLEINRLLKLAFGRRSERYLESPQQLQIDFGGGPEVIDAADGLQQAVDEKQLVDEATGDAANETPSAAAASKKKKKKRNESLPANLPRIEKIIDIPDHDKFCGKHGEKALIGYDVRESLVFIPSVLEVHVTKFAKYACPNQPECRVTQPKLPATLIEGDRYSTSIASEIITNNLEYHLPLYREQARRGRLVGDAAPRRIAVS